MHLASLRVKYVSVVTIKRNELMRKIYSKPYIFSVRVTLRLELNIINHNNSVNSLKHVYRHCKICTIDIAIL